MAWIHYSVVWSLVIKPVRTCTLYTWEGKPPSNTEQPAQQHKHATKPSLPPPRAKVEADYSNHLSVISRTVLCDEGETGDIVRALDVFSNEMATNGQSHLELARKIESDIADPLHNFSQNYIDLVSECRNRIQELCDTRDRFAAVIVEVHILSQICL